MILIRRYSDILSLRRECEVSADLTEHLENEWAALFDETEEKGDDQDTLFSQQHTHVAILEKGVKPVWVMTAAVIPFEEKPEVAEFLPYSLDDVTLRESYLSQGKPTHIVRVILRTNGSYGLCEYVDGTDLYFTVDQKKQEAGCLVWSDTWVEGPPKVEGGSLFLD